VLVHIHLVVRRSALTKKWLRR